MIDALPYVLGWGVVATKRGIIIHLSRFKLAEPFPVYEQLSGGRRRIPWEDLSHLKYQGGEPWCWYWPEFDIVRLESSSTPVIPDSCCLHRLAAVLCDDPEAFRVLYWCVHNLVVNDDS